MVCLDNFNALFDVPWVEKTLHYAANFCHRNSVQAVSDNVQSYISPENVRR
jgi:hypothetical protein